MKKKALIFAVAAAVTVLLAILTFNCNAQQYDLYKLKTKAVVTDTFSYMRWHFEDYPKTTRVYWSLPKDTAKHLHTRSGYITIPNDIIQAWTDDDRVIPEYIESQKPWAKKED